jgi:hypothetical protein
MDKQQVLEDLLTKQTEILGQLVKDRTKTPASAGNAVELHGVGSLFGSHSIEREVITAHIRPTGLGAVLPKVATVYEQPFFAGITGFTDDVGSEPTEPCDDAPRAYMKACDLTAQFGRVQRDTGTIEINDVMLKKNRGDFSDLALYGDLLGLSGFSPSSLSEEGILNLVTKAEMLIAGISLERVLSRHLWQGSIFNNAGAYKEFPGLMYQIATGQMDAHTGTLCPALDSDVKDFGLQDVSDSNDLRDIARHLSYLEAYIYHVAERSGMVPLQAALCMRPELWFALTEVYPCQYNTNKCATAGLGDSEIVINGESMVAIRDAMRAGMYIDINGRRYPVVLDDGIYEHNNANNGSLAPGEYASSIFFVPLTAAGLRCTYLEHIDYRAASVAANTALLRGTEDFWTDDGMYFWAIESEKWCYKLSVKSEQRVILRTPQLAGRIDNIKYVPVQHFRSPYPDDPYFKDGGVSMRPDTFTYHVW